MQAGENRVSSASRNTTHTMSLPMCRFLWSCKTREKNTVVSFYGLQPHTWGVSFASVYLLGVVRFVG